MTARRSRNSASSERPSAWARRPTEYCVDPRQIPPRATIALWRLGELRNDHEILREAAAQADALDMPGVAERSRAAAHAYAS